MPDLFDAPDTAVDGVADGVAYGPLDARWALPADDLLAREGRARVSAALRTAAVATADAETVDLLLSEVLGNVVRHSPARSVTLSVRDVDGAIRVTVAELGGSGPTPVREVTDPRMPGPAATSGRGLALLDTLAERWGVTRHGGRTTTWFTVTPSRQDRADDRDAELRSVRAALRRSQMLLRLTEALGRADTEHDVADAITRLVREHVGAQFTGIALVEPDGAHLRFVSLDPLPEPITSTWAQFSIDAVAPVAAAAQQGRAFFHESVADAEREFPGISEHMGHSGSAAMAHLPLVAGNRTLGVLAVTFAEARPLDADLRALLTIVAGYAAQALRRRR